MSQVLCQWCSTNIGSHLASESLVRQKDDDVNCTSSTLPDIIHFQLIFRRSYIVDCKHLACPKLLSFCILSKHVK
jgi:hypothetical protein